MNNTWNISDVYKDMSEEQFVKPEEWFDCPVCFVKPRLWIFDNGCFAKCKCDTMYGKASASGISVGEYGRNNNFDFTGYDCSHSDLRDDWNRVVNMRRRKLKIDKLLEIEQ